MPYWKMVLGINGGAIAVPSLVLGFAARTKSNATSCSCPPTVLMYYVRNECLDVLLPTYSSAGQDLVPPCPQNTSHARYADVSSARLPTVSPGFSVEHVSFHFEKCIRSRQLSDVYCTSVEPSHHRLVLPIARSSLPWLSGLQATSALCVHRSFLPRVCGPTAAFSRPVDGHGKKSPPISLHFWLNPRNS